MVGYDEDEELTLRGVSKPPIWRRIAVPAALTLDLLHEVIQQAMGWEDGTCTCSARPAGTTEHLTPTSGTPTRTRSRWPRYSPNPAPGCATPMTSGTTGNTTSSWRKSSRPIASPACRAWPARARARPRTAAGHGGTPA